MAEGGAELLELRWQGLRESRAYSPEWKQEIDRRYRMNDRILRHLTVRVEDESQVGPSPMMKPRPAETRRAS